MTIDAVDHICVCVCTYRRPRLLGRLLRQIEDQETRGLFRYSVVVVDNDNEESARGAVEAARRGSCVDIAYRVEPQKNIAAARNCAVASAVGQYIAFIDDDEHPCRDWLLRLREAMVAHDVDGVLGPVIPDFEAEPPRWLARGRLTHRRAYLTGTVLDDPRWMRTGNVLLRRDSLGPLNGPFDTRFGITGGEDTDAFERMLACGCRFVWCNEAPAYESVPPERMTRRYLLRRALLRGVATAERDGAVGVVCFVKSCVATVAYTAALPVLLFCGHHRFMKVLIKDCDHLARILAVLGIRLVSSRQ